MRKSMDVTNNNDLILNEPLFDPLKELNKEKNCNRRWVVCVWITTNIAAFMFGYYVKYKFYLDDKDLDGSL